MITTLPSVELIFDLSLSFPKLFFLFLLYIHTTPTAPHTCESVFGNHLVNNSTDIGVESGRKVYCYVYIHR